MLGQSLCHLPSESTYLEALAEEYKIADSWDTRRQVLSTMSDLANSNAISEFIPGLTRYCLTMANLHRIQHGRSAPVPIKTAPRIRIQKEQLDHFLSFITSPHLVQELPFGEKHLQLSSGKMITLPNVIRTMIPERIATQYIQYCKDTNFDPFSKRTMLHILSECSASIRKSLQGLDYFAAQGGRAFDDLVSTVKGLSAVADSNGDWTRNIQDALKMGKLYLKGDYKVHISNDSSVADHCSVHALSDPSDKTFRCQCNHEHNNVCDQCNSLDMALQDIEDVVTNAKFQSEVDRDEYMYICRSAKQAIQAWKCHQLRSIRQDQARLDILDALDDDCVFIVQDCVMKFLPQMYRESQSEEFHGTFLLSSGDFTLNCSHSLSSTFFNPAVKTAQPLF
ncbi:hypothetical protein QZH41_008003 [Actinostola sp. cb2023]|nr:hypothetical protein QZH41_008003 [Actinostola sp. cb2023]